MKRSFYILLLVLCSTIVYAGRSVKFYMSSGEVKCVAIERIDSISFDETADILRVTLFDKVADIRLSEVDSIGYGSYSHIVNITYLGGNAVVENPFAFDSVAVSIDGAMVTVYSQTSVEVDYSLTGNSENGCFKLYGDRKLNLYLNGLSLENSMGAAINIQCGKRARVFVNEGTSNFLSDSHSYATPSGEDEKAAFFSEGQLVFEGGGKLFINGNYKHALCSDDYIEVRSGCITVESARNDAFHANDSLIVFGGELALVAGGDGVDCDGPIKLLGGKVDVTAMSEDVKGIKSASYIEIDGASVTVLVGGDASKGVKCGGNFIMNSGELAVEATGNTILLVGDPSYATCIKSDSIVNISGGNIILEASGTAGRGISADTDVEIHGGTLTIECSGESGIYDPTLAGDIIGSIEENSYVVYVSIPVSQAGNRPGGQSSQAWKSVYLYSSNDSLVATLTNSVVLNGTTFYYYDFGSETSDTFYFKSDTYSGNRGTYTIQSSPFTGVTKDCYYQVLSSYTTSGSVRTYSLSDVTSSYGSAASSGSASEDSYKAAGIKCDNAFALTGGEVSVNVTGSESKGIKVEGEALFAGGKLNITTSGEAKIVAYDPSYCTAIKCDGTLDINGGEIEITAAGNGGMGISSDGILTMNDGRVNIVVAGNGSSYTASTGTDYYSTKCLKGDVAVNLLGGTLFCEAKGNGSKAIVASGMLTIGNEGAADELLNIRAVTRGASLGTSSGSGGNWGGMGGGMQQGFNAAPKAIKGAADVVVNSGMVYAETAYDGGEGLESKAMLIINGGQIECNTYDDGINAASSLIINGGYVYSHASNNDGIDSNGTITINGGVALASGTNAPEEGFDCDNNQFVINGGVVVGTGSANSSVTSASQPYSSLSSLGVTAGNYLTVKDGSGTVLFSYRCPNTVNGTSLLLSSPDFTSTSHTLLYGVTAVSSFSESYFNGAFIVGGTPTGGTSKTFTPQIR